MFLRAGGRRSPSHRAAASESMPAGSRLRSGCRAVARLRWPTTTSSLAAACLLLAGCSGPTAAPAGPPLFAAAALPTAAMRGDVDVWSWNIAAKSLQKLVPSFEHSYPGVHVTVDMTGANMPARFLLSLSCGVGAPDVSQLECKDAPRYSSTGQLADLSVVAASLKHDYPAGLMHNCMIDGRMYAIPWDMGPCAVFYKRNIFARYGIDPARIATWDDYIAAGKRILTLSHGQTKMMPLDTGALSMMFEILIQQAGGQVFDDGGGIAIDSPQSRKVLDLLRRLIQAGLCANVKMWGQEFMAGFNNDTIATYPGAAWLAGTIKDAAPDYGGQRQTWGVFRLPALVPGGPRISNYGGSVLVIPAQCANKPAAWAFVHYALCTVAGQLAQYRSENLFPAYLPALKSPVFDDADPFFSGQAIGRLFARDVTRLPILNRTPHWTEATRYIDQALSRWVDNGFADNNVLPELADRMRMRIGDDETTTRAAKAGSGGA